MDGLDTKTRNPIVRCFVEGQSNRATAAGVTDRPWDIEDIVRPVDETAPKPGPRGPCRNGISRRCTTHAGVRLTCPRARRKIGPVQEE